MDFYSVAHWEENFDELFERVENGETIGIETENGDKLVMVPVDEFEKIYHLENNEAP